MSGRNILHESSIGRELDESEEVLDFEDEVSSETEDNTEEIVCIVSDEDESSDRECDDSVSCDGDSAILLAKSGRAYVTNPPRIFRRGIENIVRENQGLPKDGRTEQIDETFKLFLTPEIVDKIVLHSNEEANRQNIPLTNVCEVYSYIGLLLLMGAEKDTSQSVHDLWSSLHGRAIYIGAMSRNRFEQLTRVLRFDDKNTREERRQNDKLAPLREVFDELNELLPKYYTSGPHTTIDEMLSLFRGRCPF